MSCSGVTVSSDQLFFFQCRLRDHYVASRASDFLILIFPAHFCLGSDSPRLFAVMFCFLHPLVYFTRRCGLLREGGDVFLFFPFPFTVED